MEQQIFPTQGTCAKFINFEVDEQNRLHNVKFMGGCPGNTVGVAKLVEGQTINDVINQLKGIKCGAKPTSCPDQLATALEHYMSAK